MTFLITLLIQREVKLDRMGLQLVLLPKARDGEQSLLAMNNLLCLSSVLEINIMSLTHLSTEASPKGSLLLLDLPTGWCGTLQALFVLSLSDLGY